MSKLAVKELSDDVLVKRARKNDLAAFDELMARYERKVVGMCFRHLRQYEDACDLAQEIFLQVFKRLERFESRSSFSTWLYRVSLNACYNRHRHLKAKGRNTVTSLEGILEARPGENKLNSSDKIMRSGDRGALAILESKEATEQVRQALEQMDESYSKVLDLVDIEGLSYKETSGILKIPVTTLRARLFRARKILKEKIVKTRKRLDEA